MKRDEVIVVGVPSQRWDLMWVGLFLFVVHRMSTALEQGQTLPKRALYVATIQSRTVNPAVFSVLYVRDPLFYYF